MQNKRSNQDREIHWYHEGDKAYGRRHYAEAVECYQLATRNDPDDHFSWALMGLSYAELKNNRGALRSLRKAITIDSRNTDYWSFLGSHLNSMNRYHQAIHAYYRAVQITPKDPVIWNSIATTHWNAGGYEIARDGWKKALRLDPNNLYALHQLAEYYRMTGEHKKELSYDHRIVAIDPKDHKIWLEIGLTYMALGKHQEARDAIQKAHDIRPKNKKYNAWLVYALDSLHMPCDSTRHLFNSGAVLKWNDLASLESASYWLAEGGEYQSAKQVDSRVRDIEGKKVRALMNDIMPERVIHSGLPRIVSASTDLKLTPDGKVKIFEFNDLWRSGYEGFTRLTGIDLSKDILKPHRGNLVREWRRSGLPIKRIKTPSDDMFRGIAYYARSLSNTTPGVVYENSDAGFSAVCDNKDYMALKTPSELQQYFPKTLVLPLGSLTKDQIVEKLRETFGNDRPANLVIKPPDGLHGRGVNILPSADVADYILSIPTQTLPAGYAGDFWNSRRLSTVLVQECIQSQPIQAKDGLFYDGTMRVAYTAVLHPDNPVPEIYFHAGWWKLPQNPITDDAMTRESIVSFSPCFIEGDPNKHKPFSAKVVSQQRKLVEQQLRAFLTSFIPPILATPQQMGAEIKDLLSSSDTTSRVMATRLATNNIIGDYMVLSSGPRLKQEFLQQIAQNEIAYPHDASATFVGNLRQIFEQPVVTARDYFTVSTLASYIDPRPDFLPEANLV